MSLRCRQGVGFLPPMLPVLCHSPSRHAEVLQCCHHRGWELCYSSSRAHPVPPEPTRHRWVNAWWHCVWHSLSSASVWYPIDGGTEGKFLTYLDLHVLAETFPSTTGVFLHYSCQAWISASGKAFSPRRQGNLNGCFILSVTRFLFQGILTLFLSVCCKELFHVTFKSKHSVLNYK